MEYHEEIHAAMIKKFLVVWIQMVLTLAGLAFTVGLSVFIVAYPLYYMVGLWGITSVSIGILVVAVLFVTAMAAWSEASK